MGNRITRVTTRTGDTGTSGTATGRRLPKTDALFAALGDVDELGGHAQATFRLDITDTAGGRFAIHSGTGAVTCLLYTSPSPRD